MLALNQFSMQSSYMLHLHITAFWLQFAAKTTEPGFPSFEFFIPIHSL